MTSFALPIFPEGSLTDSVVVTVWLGVMVVSYFHLRFGWTYSGLVVPGYLVPLLLTKPLAACVVLTESVITYSIVWLFSVRLSRLGMWCNLFGRDRFFALVLVSVGVRVGLDGYVLPRLSRLLTEEWRLAFDASENLHSFGLIIVSLIANQFWKPGFRGGVLPLLVCLTITHLLVRYPLMWFTNFSIGSLEYMYEEISVSVLSSPKAYVVLVSTAFMASRMNLFYAWDYSGILIPSLLALQWYEPLKIVTSLAEAWLVYLAGCLVLKTPLLREATVEGARKVVLFFNIAVAYKIVLGHLIAFVDPTAHVTDWFGCGYLLPTLIAIKMHDKGISVRITRTTIETSLTGALVAGALGFGLTFLPQEWLWTRAAPTEVLPLEAAAERDLTEVLREEKVLLYDPGSNTTNFSPVPTEVEAFASGLRLLLSHLEGGDPELLERARRRLARANYQLLGLQGGLWCLKESEPRRGWGVYVLRGGAKRSLVVSVPAPLNEWGTLESGAYFFRTVEARALAVFTPTERGVRNEQRLLSAQATFFNTFHRVAGRAEVLQVRGSSAATLRRFYGMPQEQGAEDGDELPSSLWVTRSLPASLPLDVVAETLRDFRLEWRPPPLTNPQREASSCGFAELFLSREDRKRLVARFFLPAGGGAGAANAAFTEGHVEEFLLARKAQIAPKGWNGYTPPPPDVLFFLDEEVLKPLLALVYGPLGQNLATDLDTIHAAARAASFSLTRLRDVKDGEEFLVIHDGDGGGREPCRGTFAFRLHGARPYVVEVPRPLHEKSTVEYGVHLFQRLRAVALLVPGAHPHSNADGSADVLLVRNKGSAFNLVSQAIVRERGEAELTVVQVRACGGNRDQVELPADALLAVGDGSEADGGLVPWVAELKSVVESDHVNVVMVDGSPATMGYEADGSAQFEYLELASGKHFVALWLSPWARLQYRESPERTVQRQAFDTLEIDVVEESLPERLAGARFAWGEVADACGLIDLLTEYLRTEDPNAFYAVRRRWPGLRPQCVVDRATRRPFLLLASEDALVPAVASLSFQPHGTSVVYCRGGVDLETARRFAGSAAALLVVESVP